MAGCNRNTRQNNLWFLHGTATLHERCKISTLDWNHKKRPQAYAFSWESTKVDINITVGNHLSEHVGTKGCSDNWNVQISEQYNSNAKQVTCHLVHSIITFGVRITKDSVNWSSDTCKWLPTVVHTIIGLQNNQKLWWEDWEQDYRYKKSA